MNLKREYFYKHQLEIILIFGILLRIIVFIFQGPFNNDDHFVIIQYIHNHLAFPVFLSDHPPLYYILASLFFSDNVKTVQLFSLILSIGSIVVIYRLIKSLNFIQPLKTKRYCLLLACTLPQLIMFGNYISNDTLSFFIGVLIFSQIFKYIYNPNMINQNILAVYLGLGLLTKGTFLFFIPVLLLLIILINLKRKINFKKIALSLLVFICIFLALGSYKYVQNTVHFGRPIVTYNTNEPMYIGLESVLKSISDVNILKLLRYPTVSEHTNRSYLLLLYGTFWYQYIPESNFEGNMTVFKYLGSCIYVLALVPTLIFFIGSFKILFSIKNLFRHKISEELLFNNTIYEAISLFLLLSSLLMIIILGVKQDLWSWFQSRYMFPCFFSVIILFNSGLKYINRKNKMIQNIATYSMVCLFFLFITYFVIEIGRQV